MIRLQRVGRIHEPVFRLVLTDSKNGPKSGRFLEILGSFDSRNAEAAKFDEVRVKYWMGHGAKMSDTVHNLFLKRKLIVGEKRNKIPKNKTKIVETIQSTQAQEPAAVTESTSNEPQSEPQTAAEPSEIAESIAENTKKEEV